MKNIKTFRESIFTNYLLKIISIVRTDLEAEAMRLELLEVTRCIWDLLPQDNYKFSTFIGLLKLNDNSKLEVRLHQKKITFWKYTMVFDHNEGEQNLNHHSRIPKLREFIDALEKALLSSGELNSAISLSDEDFLKFCETLNINENNFIERDLIVRKF